MRSALELAAAEHYLLYPSALLVILLHRRWFSVAYKQNGNEGGKNTSVWKVQLRSQEAQEAL